MSIIDTHAHLYEKDVYKDITELVNKLKNNADTMDKHKNRTTPSLGIPRYHPCIGSRQSSISHSQS